MQDEPRVMPNSLCSKTFSGRHAWSSNSATETIRCYMCGETHPPARRAAKEVRLTPAERTQVEVEHALADMEVSPQTPVRSLDDLFELDPWIDGKLRRSYLHLVDEDYGHDDGWTVRPESADILTCKRCGSLVRDDSADVHLLWHVSIA